MTPFVIVFALVLFVAVASTLPASHAQFQIGGVDKDGSWYVGEGLKQGDYFSYSMCHVYYKECSNFRFDFWIEGDIQVGTETKWLVKTVIYDGNEILVGDMELSKLVPEQTGGSEETIAYRSAFKSSVTWLSAFATPETHLEGKGPKEFRSASWGKIGNIGGEQILPTAIEEIYVAGETWDTVQVGWRTGGAVSKIWIVDEFPFPIKAKTYTHVSSGIPPTEYEFVMLEYMEGIKTNPFEDVTATVKLPEVQGCDTNFDRETVVKKSTKNAMYQVHVFYGPEYPAHGCNMQWIINFISKYNVMEHLNQVQFDVFAVDDEMRLQRSIASEEGKMFLYSPSGQYVLDMTIKEEPGTANYAIWIYGLAPENVLATEPDDYVIIPIEVQPNKVQPDEVQPSIPEWVKTNAGWWAEGQIDDSSFVQGIQYLINQDIILIPETESDGTDSTTNIPEWIKTNAGWWADGQIDDNTFIQAIQFLIKNGIIIIS